MRLASSREVRALIAERFTTGLLRMLRARFA
jgi:hypothetical protein